MTTRSNFGFTKSVNSLRLVNIFVNWFCLSDICGGGEEWIERQALRACALEAGFTLQLSLFEIEASHKEQTPNVTSSEITKISVKKGQWLYFVPF